jgi:hypothetical protein
MKRDTCGVDSPNIETTGNLTLKFPISLACILPFFLEECKMHVWFGKERRLNGKGKSTSKPR